MRSLEHSTVRSAERRDIFGTHSSRSTAQTNYHSARADFAGRSGRRARVLAARVANPQPHIGKIYHLIGPQSEENMHVYAQYSYLLAMIRGYRGD